MKGDISQMEEAEKTASWATREETELMLGGWEPTKRLRWLTGLPVGLLRHRDVATVLQQEWVNAYSGDRQWRDVPTVMEEPV